MKSAQKDKHSFIVRVWREHREIKGEEPELRGEILHVPDNGPGGMKDKKQPENKKNFENGKPYGLKDLSDIISFIASYFNNAGVKNTRRRRWRKWLRH